MKTNSNSIRRLALTGATTLGLLLARTASLSAQDLYATYFGDSTVEKFTPSGVGTVYASIGLNEPISLAFDAAGNLYVGNYKDNTIEKITPGGAATVFANSGLDDPAALAFDAAGNLYVANTTSGTILKITPSGTSSVFANTSSPDALAFDAAGNLYVANYYSDIQEFTPDGVGTLFARTNEQHPSGLAFDAAGNLYTTTSGSDASTIEKFTPDGVGTVFATNGLNEPDALAFDAAGNLYVANSGDSTIEKFTPDGVGTVFASTGTNAVEGLAFAPASASSIPPSTFFDGETALSNGVYYLSFPNGNYFGYYSFLPNPRYIYHFDLGFEYIFDAADGKSGVCLYDFTSSDFFYTSPTFPFPYLYDFKLKTTLYYYPDPNNPGHYNTNGTRYFYDFATGKIITK